MRLFGEVVLVLGVPRSVGQIYGLLFASRQPLSFSDIVERIKISKGSVSQGLHLLRTLGAVKLLPRPDGRSGERVGGAARDYYEPELSLRKLVRGVLQEQIGPMAMVGADHFTRLRRLVEADAERNVFLRERVSQLEAWRKRFETALPVLDVLLGPRKG